MNGQWECDYDFETFIKYVQNHGAIVQLEKNIDSIMLDEKKWNLQEIINTLFNGNIELAVFILTRLNWLCSKADAEEFEALRAQCEQKIDVYIEKLKKIEGNIAKNKAQCEAQKTEPEEEQK